MARTVKTPYSLIMGDIRVLLWHISDDVARATDFLRIVEDHDVLHFYFYFKKSLRALAKVANRCRSEGAEKYRIGKNMVSAVDDVPRRSWIPGRNPLYKFFIGNVLPMRGRRLFSIQNRTRYVEYIENYCVRTDRVMKLWYRSLLADIGFLVGFLKYLLRKFENRGPLYEKEGLPLDLLKDAFENYLDNVRNVKARFELVAWDRRKYSHKRLWAADGFRVLRRTRYFFSWMDEFLQDMRAFV